MQNAHDLDNRMADPLSYGRFWGQLAGFETLNLFRFPEFSGILLSIQKFLPRMERRFHPPKVRRIDSAESGCAVLLR